jgi:hypothetical protein
MPENELPPHDIPLPPPPPPKEPSRPEQPPEFTQPEPAPKTLSTPLTPLTPPTLPKPAPKPPPAMMPKEKKNYTIVINRGSRAVSTNDFEIIINGTGYGKIKAGKSVTFSGSEPEIELVVKAWGLNPLKTKLKMGENAYIEVTVWKTTISLNNVSGAEIIN